MSTTSTPMVPTQSLNAPQRFFWEHAGWSYTPKKQSKAQGRTVGAIELAAAEALFFDAEAYASFAFRVVADEEATSEEGAQRWLMLIEDTEGRVVASLGAIDDDSTTYRRVVRAELAMQCLEQMQEAIAQERGEA